MGEAEVERESLRDLGRLMEEAERWGVRLLVIGGYAVRAYTRAYRYTKDIDLATTREGLGRLKGLLQSLGYILRETEFGVAGSKRFDEGFIDLHISVERIFDVSTGLSTPVTDEMSRDAGELPVEGFYEESKPYPVKVPVISLETLVLLKLIPVGREKDAVDLMALLIDKGREVNVAKLSEACEQWGLGSHLVSQLRYYADYIRRGEVDRLWFNLTGLRLTHVEKRATLRFIRHLINRLRISQPSETP